ncbi:MAG: neutral/alkaline non-lysosomal ceramidase N-terminal domain-containing protein [Isosphaeraceae bacterium]|nr:neutral/alkaline non-lysosomal ceramidase N-terminal domain-containing protein [Isosphaeraceae bacterium]
MRAFWIVALSAFITVPAGVADELSAGVAVVDITPPVGYRMAGYYQERPSTGTLDPLYAKALVLKQGDRKVALVFCDLVAVPLELSADARSQASTATGIPAENIAIAATHSHTGPLYCGVLRDFFHQRTVASEGKDSRESVDYSRTLAKKVAQAITEAAAQTEPVRLEAGTAEETRISFNRRFHMKDGSVRFNPGVLNPDIVRTAGPIDPEVGLILARPLGGGKPITGLTVFALHLDTVGGTQYSADYPHVLEESLRKELGSSFVSLFGAGTCGDINHVDVKSKERLATAVIGRHLAETVLAALPRLEPVRQPELAMTRRIVDVPTRKVTPAELSDAKARIADIGTSKLPFLDAVRTVTTLDLEKAYPDQVAKLEVQVLRLGPDHAAVFLPGEVFVDLGLAIKRGSPFKQTLVIELTNSIPAYIPTKKAFGEGSYEIVNSRVEPGGGERLVEAALELLKELKARR